MVEKAKSITAVEQWPYRAVARALEVIPRTLIQNCGANTIRTITALRVSVVTLFFLSCLYFCLATRSPFWKNVGKAFHLNFESWVGYSNVPTSLSIWRVKTKFFPLQLKLDGPLMILWAITSQSAQIWYWCSRMFQYWYKISNWIQKKRIYGLRIIIYYPICSIWQAKHATGGNTTWGVDGESGEIVDMKEFGIWEPFSVKNQVYKTAVEVGNMHSVMNILLVYTLDDLSRIERVVALWWFDQSDLETFWISNQS